MERAEPPANGYAKFIFQFGNQHIQMLLAQAGDDLLVGFRVVFVSDGRVSSISLCSEEATLASSPLACGLMAMLRQGRGKLIGSKLTTFFGSHRVSPVWGGGDLVTAPISPAVM